MDACLACGASVALGWLSRLKFFHPIERSFFITWDRVLDMEHRPRHTGADTCCGHRLSHMTLCSDMALHTSPCTRVHTPEVSHTPPHTARVVSPRHTQHTCLCICGHRSEWQHRVWCRLECVPESSHNTWAQRCDHRGEEWRHQLCILLLDSVH